MARIPIPYDKSTLPLDVPEENLKAVLTANADKYIPPKSETELIRDALERPIGSDRLRELARGKQKVLIITSDHTRAVPSKLTLPLLLREIRAGSPDADITILIATGLHRATTEEEQRSMFGDDVVEREKIVVHNAFDAANMVHICQLPSGAQLEVNRLATQCDLLVAEGFIEPHFFAGFSGGRKSVLPGICSAATVNENHSYRAIAHEKSVTGVLRGNPIHEDMVFAARKIGLKFILNVALNGEKKVIGAFAGDAEKAHEAGCGFVKELSQVPAVTGDIVVTSNGGYPLDQNLYQSPKAISTAEACAGEDGVIIMVASCRDGMGGTYFSKLMLSGDIYQIDHALSKVPPAETVPEQWCAQRICKTLMKHPIIIVTTYLDHDIIRKANLLAASSLDEAMEMAFQMKGRDASVVVIPDGVAVLAVKS